MKDSRLPCNETQFSCWWGSDYFNEEWHRENALWIQHNQKMQLSRLKRSLPSFCNPSELLSQVQQTGMHSAIAKLLYLSTRCWPDIALPVNYLCGRVNKCDAADLEKLNKILHYLNTTVDTGITLKCNEPKMSIDAFIDASYGINKDRKSQTGVSIFAGSGSVVRKSVKQRINTKSSTEAELIACSDSVAHIHQIKNILTDLGEQVEQVNKSTITLLTNKKPVSQQSRHIDIRYFFMRDQVNHGFRKVHCDTKKMMADVMTKPMTRNQFIYLRNLLLGKIDRDPERSQTKVALE